MATIRPMMLLGQKGKAMSQDPNGGAEFLDAIRGMGALALCTEPRWAVSEAEDSSRGGAFRHLVLEEWLWEVIARREQVAEADFKQWLEAARELCPRDEPKIEELRRQASYQARQWLAAGPEAGPEGTRAASGFGWAPFLEIAAACWGWEVPRVFRFFASFSELDGAAGRATGGLLAVLLAQAVQESPYRAGFGAWFFNTAGRCLRTLRRARTDGPDAAQLGWLEQIEDRLVQGYERGRQLASAPAEVLQPQAQEAEADAMALWGRLAFVLSSGGKELPRILDGFQSSDPGDRAAGHLVSLLAGAWYGQQALESAWGAGIREAEARLGEELGVQPGLRAQMFYELSQLLLEAPTAGASS